MQVIVLGAGAIGSLYGAKLARAGHDVTLIGRAEHVHAINAHGLRVEGLESEVVRLRAAVGLEQIGPEALLLLTTKVPGTTAALTPIAPLVRADTTILSLQNGLGVEELARSALGGRGVVLRGITQFGAIFQEPGVIRYMFAGYTLVEQHGRGSRLADVFNSAGLDCRISEKIRADVWRKVIYNCVVNPITAMIGSEVGEITNPRLNRLKSLVVDECVAVAAAEGIVFSNDLREEIDRAFAGSRNLVSMLQDLEHGRPTEIDYMNGAVAALGAEHGLPCPVNASLTSIIKAMERR